MFDEDPAGSAEAIMSFASAKYGRKELIRAPPSCDQRRP
jgi:hypothetical protein